MAGAAPSSSGSAGTVGPFSLTGLVVGALVAVGVLFFVFQNTAEVTFAWLWWNLTAPMWALAIALVAAGMLLGVALSWRRGRRAGR